MPTFNDFRIGTRFSALLVIFFLGFALFGLTAYLTLEKLKVNGPLYQRIVQNKDLVADILPPPEYILESYLVCLQLARAGDPQAQDRLVQRLKALREDYDTRHAYWRQAGLEEPAASLLLDKSYQPVVAFYKAAGELLVPAVAKADAPGIEAALTQLEAAYETHRAAIDEVVVIANQRAAAAEIEGREADQEALWTLGVIFALSLGGSLGFMVLITRSVLRPVAEAVRVAQTFASGDLRDVPQPHGKDETAQLLGALGAMRNNLCDLVSRTRYASEAVALASAEIANGNVDLSTRTEHQASSLQEAASSMEELGSTVKHNADNATRAREVAESAAEVAVQGGGVVGEVVSTMQAIQASSQHIADIIGVIDGIAFQTNILALNAAVEAARAGDAGRGFAVVAGEVRNLAVRSAQAAKQVKVLIQSSVERIDQGAMLADQAGQTMHSVVAEIQRVAQIMGEISVASSEQSVGVSRLGVAVTLLDRSTQQNSALVEEMAAAASGLSHQATELVQMVSAFQVSDTELAA